MEGMVKAKPAKVKSYFCCAKVERRRGRDFRPWLCLITEVLLLSKLFYRLDLRTQIATGGRARTSIEAVDSQQGQVDGWFFPK